MIIVIICACIVGGMWWRTENRLQKLEWRVMMLEGMEFNQKITLLAKDMLEMQTTVSNLVYRTNSNRLTKNLGLKPKNKKK